MAYVKCQNGCGNWHNPDYNECFECWSGDKPDHILDARCENCGGLCNSNYALCAACAGLTTKQVRLERYGSYICKCGEPKNLNDALCFMCRLRAGKIKV